jgi:hypothetical protein
MSVNYMANAITAPNYVEAKGVYSNFDLKGKSDLGRLINYLEKPVGGLRVSAKNHFYTLCPEGDSRISRIFNSIINFFLKLYNDGKRNDPEASNRLKELLNATIPELPKLAVAQIILGQGQGALRTGYENQPRFKEYLEKLKNFPSRLGNIIEPLLDADLVSKLGDFQQHLVNLRKVPLSLELGNTEDNVQLAISRAYGVQEEQQPVPVAVVEERNQSEVRAEEVYKEVMANARTAADFLGLEPQPAVSSVEQVVPPAAPSAPAVVFNREDYKGHLNLAFDEDLLPIRSDYEIPAKYLDSLAEECAAILNSTEPSATSLEQAMNKLVMINNAICGRPSQKSFEGVLSKIALYTVQIGTKLPASGKARAQEPVVVPRQMSLPSVPLKQKKTDADMEDFRRQVSAAFNQKALKGALDVQGKAPTTFSALQALLQTCQNELKACRKKAEHYSHLIYDSSNVVDIQKVAAKLAFLAASIGTDPKLKELFTLVQLEMNKVRALVNPVERDPALQSASKALSESRATQKKLEYSSRGLSSAELKQRINAKSIALMQKEAKAS